MSLGLMQGFPIDVLNSDKDAIDVSIQSSTNRLFHYYLMTEDKVDILLTEDIVPSLTKVTINVTPGHGFTAVLGELIVLYEQDYFLQLVVISVTSNEITVRSPVTQPFTIANCKVVRGNCNMGVNGSLAQKYFYFKPYNLVSPIDLKTAHITMLHRSLGDDGQFGDIDSLDPDKAFNIVQYNSEFKSLGSMISNQCFKHYGFKVTYIPSSPSGVYGTDMYLDLEEIYGEYLRVFTDIYCRFG